MTSKASFESTASRSGLFDHFWRDDTTIRCPNSHLVTVGLLLVVGELAVVGDLDYLQKLEV